MTRDEAGVQRFVERLGGLYEASGMARIPARLMACFLIDEDGRMTSAEIAEALQVSPAAVSSATKVLLQMGLVRKERQPGSRANAYVLVDDDWYTALLAHDRTLELHLAYLSEAVEAAGGTATAAGRRLNLSVELFTMLNEHMADFLPRWERRKAELLAE